MKLRNKKTGEIVYATMMASYGGGELQIRYYPVDRAEDTRSKEYRSISELNAEWEDYEEPKVYYYISDFGAIRECEIGKFPEDEEDRKQIGNYFETREETEKAVERLRAWKRLEDKGFRFIPEASYVEQTGETEGGMMFIACTMNDYRDFAYGDNADIKLLFSQEVKHEMHL